MIYVLEAPNRTVKIGFSKSRKSLKSRISSLRTSSAVDLKLLKTTEGTMDDEQAIHRLLNQFRVRGEWFSCDQWRDPLMKNVVRLLDWKGAAFVLSHTEDQLRNFNAFPCIRLPANLLLNPGRYAGVRLDSTDTKS